MATPERQEEGKSCPIQCPGCAGGFGQDGPAQAGVLRGGRLAAAACVAFLSPLVTAVVGAVVAPRVWEHPHSRAVGAAAGLALGVVDAIVMIRLMKGGRGASE